MTHLSRKGLFIAHWQQQRTLKGVHVHVFLSSVEKKLRFFMKTFQDFLHIMDFNGNQMVRGPNESFSAASKGFK